MKNFILFIFSILSYSVYAQQWEWAKIVDSTLNNPSGNSLTADSVGGFYLSTNFSDGSGSDIGTCILKYDNLGNELWRKYLTGDISISGIVYSNSNIYITGLFNNTIHIENDTFISNGLTDVFIANITSNGIYTWGKSFGGNGYDLVHGICSDANSNIYITGGYYSDSINFGDSALVRQGTDNAFLAKFNSFGDILFSKSAGGIASNADSYGKKIQADQFGNIYILGNYNEIMLDTVYLIAYGYPSNFLCKLDSNGNVIWAKEICGGTEELFDITLDETGHILTTGYYGWTHGGHTITRKYNTNGQLLWDKNISSACDGYGDYFVCSGLALQNNDTYIIGVAETPYCPSWSPYKQFLLAKYDSTGSLLLFDTLKVTGPEISNITIVKNSNGDFIICGTIFGSITIGNDSLYSLSRKVFIAKFKGDLTTDIVNINLSEGINFYPNPTSGIFTICFNMRNANTKICVYDILGKCVLNKITSKELRQNIDLSSQSKGVYFLEISSDKERTVKKIVLE